MTDSITVLVCDDQHIATKRVSIVGDELRVLSSYDSGFWFEFFEWPVANITDLSQALSEITREPRALVIRGAPLPGVRGQVRRLMHARPDHPASFVDRDHHWVAHDFDDAPLPDEVDLIRNPEHAVRLLVTQHLPPAFHGASCFYQFTSQARPRSGSLRVRLWYWHNRAVANEELEAWAIAERVQLDDSLFRVVQPIYTAAPIFVGCPDWLPRRCGLLRGERDVVEFPHVVSTAKPHPAREYTAPAENVANSFLARAFRYAGWLGEPLDADRIAARCPWERLHKANSGASSTIIFAARSGSITGWFHLQSHEPRPEVAERSAGRAPGRRRASGRG